MAEDSDHHHEHGGMDISEQEKTFGAFMNVIVYSCLIVAIILIFLALVNT